MRKPEYGKAVTLHWEGYMNLGSVDLVGVPSTLQLGDDLQDEVDEAWRKHLEKHPDDYEGQLWRFEGIADYGNGMHTNVSPITYPQHVHCRVLQLDEEVYPNPLGISVLQVTADNFAIAGKHFDGRGLVSLESRFIDRAKNETILGTLLNPDKRETEYEDSFLTPEFLKRRGVAWAVITGALHDTGIGIYVPVPLRSAEIGLKTGKHKDLVMIPLDTSTINGILETGKYKGLDVVDQLLGSLDALVNNRERLHADYA